MCRRLSQYRGIHDFVDALSMPNPMVTNVGDLPFDHYNIAPSKPVALIHMDGDVLLVDHVRWGWRPDWTDRQVHPNGRVEKVAHNPYYRPIWPHRAIAPIDNWFEWVDEGGPKKQPYLIRHIDQAPILCASIGQFPAGGREPQQNDGFVIITADSVGGMVDIHDRRPVVLSPDLAREWLDPATPKERAEQIAMFQGEPTDVFEWFRVSTDVGNVRNQGPQLILCADVD